MKYVSIREWILSQDSIHYDFVEDTIDSVEALEDYKKIDNVIDRFFIYRAGRYYEGHNKMLEGNAPDKCNQFIERSKKYRTKDPDQFSGLLRQIYIYLWGYVFLDKYCRCSDTMTSAQILLNQCIECIKKEKNENQLSIIYKKKKFKVTTNSSIALAACNKDTGLYDSLNEKFPNLTSFLSLYHTIGNYCPIPEGFNLPRSSWGKKDFWDRTLMCIRCYYLQPNIIEKKRIIREDLLNNHKASNPCKVIEWLSFFGEGDNGWKRFVEFNFFQDYVDSEYKVIPFWEDHNINTFNMPTTRDELNNMLERICNRIEARGKRIVDTIKMADCITLYHC